MKILLNKYRDCFAPLAMTLNSNVIAREERPKQSKNLYQISNTKNFSIAKEKIRGNNKNMKSKMLNILSNYLYICNV